MKPPQQESLFDDPKTPAPAADLLRIDQGAAELNPAQRSFNRLTQQIARARLMVEQWKLMQQRVHDRVRDEMLPGTQALTALQRQLIEQIDALLMHPPKGLKLTRRQRDALTKFLLMRIEDAVTDVTDEALEAIYQHHSGISLDERRRVERDLQMEYVEGMASELFGDDVVAEHGAESVEELLRHVQERMDERFEAEQREREERAAQRRRNRRPSAAELRREQAAQAAGASVREVYRKLVSSLHPDRETDPVERLRKTGLMQQINQAYQANDLLTLLTLQMEVEQIKAATLATLPAQRLQHYNEVLREQLRTLQNELKSYAQDLEDQLGAGPRQYIREPRDAERLFERQMRELHLTQTRYRSTLSALANPHLRGAEIAAIAAAMSRR
ncbi:MAG: J domain-containing protein [Lysobacterales bacterium]